MNRAIASIYYDLFMYYLAQGDGGVEIKFTNNMAALFIDYQCGHESEFNRKFICAEQNPKIYDEIYGLSAHLRQFYLEMYHWINNKECKYQFSPIVGMCCNLYRYAVANNVRALQRLTLMDMLSGQFISAGLNEDFPFNDGFRYRYDNEVNKYSNQQRIDWIKQHAT